MCLRQHSTFFLVLGDILCRVQNITENMKNLLGLAKVLSQYTGTTPLAPA
jgi:hypothetical protein